MHITDTTLRALIFCAPQFSSARDSSSHSGQLRKKPPEEEILPVPCFHRMQYQQACESWFSYSVTMRGAACGAFHSVA